MSPHVTRSPGFLICIYVLQAIKDWRQEWPGDEATHCSSKVDGDRKRSWGIISQQWGKMIRLELNTPVTATV